MEEDAAHVHAAVRRAVAMSTVSTVRVPVIVATSESGFDVVLSRVPLLRRTTGGSRAIASVVRLLDNACSQRARVHAELVFGVWRLELLHISTRIRACGSGRAGSCC